MKIKLTERGYESCNFCKRGKLNADWFGLTYPYKDILTISTDGNGLTACMCLECAKKLSDFVVSKK